MDNGAYAIESGLVTKKRKLPKTFIHYSHHFQPLAPFFSSNFASFPLLADYSLVKLTSKETIKVAKDYKYLISTKTLSKASFNLFYATQIVKLLPDNDIICYIIYLSNIINKVNITLFSIKCKQVIHNILATKMYAMVYRLNIKKRYWGRYHIIKKKSDQY